MAVPRYTVAIVVDPAFPESRLASLASHMPVWVADTPANRATAERLRAADPDADGVRRGVTTFRVDPASASGEWCAGILGAVHEHHGEFSHDPPYEGVEVYGAHSEPELLEAFAARGFTEVEQLPDGFRARSRPAL